MAVIASPFATTLSAAPAYRLPGNRYHILATGVQTNNAFSLIHQTVYEGWKTETRYHTQHLGIYVLKGQCTIHLDSAKDLEAHSGDHLAIPPFTEYCVTATGRGTEFLIFSTPAGFEQIIVGASTPAETEGAPPSDLPNVPAQHLQTLYAQYGCRVTGTNSDPGDASKAHHLDPTFATPSPTLTNASTVPAYWVCPAIPELWAILVSTSHTTGSYTLTSSMFTRGNACAPISYDTRDETYFILSGQCTFLLGGTVQSVSAGHFVFIPRGTVFALRVDSETMRTLMWHTPGGLIEACAPMLGGLAAPEGNRREEMPADLKPPLGDVELFVAKSMTMGIRFCAVADPLKV